ncbi:uncharacterized protein LOC112561295 [Pomacea canaliculata]|uniref:uncharacterized protein LOC112561295 n=1 Tax=Pomacea canaliculata TaxID=400727 RepID=UPI000D73BAC1|nr:uncharacterized protein LOC112561295 [Pomacea canaliculata]XP_025089478.1 uncharacterized protein LOC112561295 [Pomacea canaliculata]
MATKELIVLLVLIDVACGAVPDYEYTAGTVKPLFDQMYDYGEFKKKETGTRYHQFLVVLVASISEITNVPHEDLTTQDGVLHFENVRFKNRVRFVLNDNQHAIQEFNPNRPLHGEMQCIHTGILDKMITEYKRIKEGHEFPIVLMYSLYIPCANIPDLSYSCSEELAIFACRRRQDAHFVVAYSHIYNRTDEKKAVEFLSTANILGFRYQRNSQGTCDLVSPYEVKYTERHLLLQELFKCLNNTISRSRFPRKPADRTEIIAYYVNSMAYECFGQENGRLRDQNRQRVQSCFHMYANKSIGFESLLSNMETVNKDKQDIAGCITNVFALPNLLPGQPKDPFNPFSDTWSSTADPKLNETFPESPASRRGPRQMCVEPELTLESLCTQKGKQRRGLNIQKRRTPRAAAVVEKKMLAANRKGARKGARKETRKETTKETRKEKC